MRQPDGAAATFGPAGAFMNPDELTAHASGTKRSQEDSPRQLDVAATAFGPAAALPPPK